MRRWFGAEHEAWHATRRSTGHGSRILPHSGRRPLPVSVFLDLMGLPLDKRDTFVEWAMQLLHSQSRDAMAGAMHSISTYLKQVIAEKTAHPDNKVISRIVHATVDGRAMTPPEIFGFVIFLFIVAFLRGLSQQGGTRRHRLRNGQWVTLPQSTGWSTGSGSGWSGGGGGWSSGGGGFSGGGGSSGGGGASGDW